jgi:uncharacterized protein YqgV (UPF0045/DUF77 family)
MKISIDLSLYPLSEDYKTRVKAFRAAIESYQPAIEIKRNAISTQIFGEYDTVMDIIQRETKALFLDGNKYSLIAKIINSDLRK